MGGNPEAIADLMRFLDAIHNECWTWRPTAQELIIIRAAIRNFIQFKKPRFVPEELLQDIAFASFHFGVCFERAKRQIEVGEL